MSMRTLCLTGLVLLGLIRCSLAQDVLYLNDQSRIEGNLTELTREKVAIQVSKGGAPIKFSYGADRVLAIVNRRGRFVCLDQLWYMPAEKRNRVIEQFRKGSEGLTQDMLIRQHPVQIIYGKITGVQGNIVSYVPVGGNPSRIARSELIALFYQSGKHELLSRASLLCDQIDQMGGSFPPVSSVADVRTKPVASPAATPARPAPKATPRPAPAPEPAAEAPAEPPVVTPLAAAIPDSTAAPGTPGYTAVLRLTDAEYEEYRLQALERVEEFGTLLGVVADKTVEAGQKDKAITEILTMFKPEATIQVSSTGKAPTTLRMQDYLRRLKLLPYTSVNIEWTDVQYVQELTQRTDGNYYGKIRGEQRFLGLNEKTGRQYSDITQKDVDVMLTPYSKQKEGLAERKWAVLLGNVGVVATQ